MRKREKRSRGIKIYLLFGLLLTFTMMLIVSVVGRKEFSAPHKFALEAIGIAQVGVTKVADYFKSFAGDYLELVNVREENRRLREEIKQYKAANTKYREAVATNVRFANLLELKEALPSPTVTVEIIGRDPSPWFKTVIVNRGSNDGVRKGMPAVTIEGVVGQVLDTSPHYAKILLANDPNSAIDVIIQRTRTQAIVKGQGGRRYAMNYVLKNAEVEKGDVVITSGLDGMFPKGLPVGIVDEVVKTGHGMFQKVEVEPAVDFSRLEFCLIILRELALTE